MNTRPMTAWWQGVAAAVLFASTLSAASPFTLRFGATGSMVIDMDPASDLLAYQLGYRTDALVGYDALYDVPKPSITPPGGGVPILFFPADAPIYGLSQDFRPLAGSQAWQMNLIGMAASSAVTLQWRLQDGSLAGNALSLVDQPSGAVLVADMTATTSYTFSATDRTLLVLYGPANHPPVALGDQFAMLEADGTLAIPFASLLANDYDPDAGDAITVVDVGAPYLTVGGGKGVSAYGTTVIDTVAGTVTYTLPTPLPADWDGTVYFQYTIRDDETSAAYEGSAAVEITVAPHVLTVPVPRRVAAHPNAPFTVAYTLVYSGPVQSLSLSFTLPTAGSGPALTFWPYGGSYGDDAAATADPVVTSGAGADGAWGTADDTGVVILNYGTAVPPTGTTFSFLINMPANGTDATVPSLALYKVTGAEPSALEQILPNLAVKVAHTVTFSSAGNGVVQGSVTQLLEPGQFGTAVTAVPAPGYHFLRWMRGDVEVSRANPLVLAGGTDDMTIIAEFQINTYTVTFTTTGTGSLSGATTQQIPHGDSTTPVTAVPGAGWYFSQWTDGSTANPRTVTNVTADATYTAVFLALVPGDPAGDFELVYRNQSDPGLRKIWDLSGHYVWTSGTNTITLDWAHDEKGAILGTGRFQGTVGGQAVDIPNMAFKGSGKGKAGVVTVKGSVGGAAGTASASFKLALTLDVPALSLVGTVSGKVSDSVGGNATVSGPMALALPAGMDGSYRLPVHLILDGSKGTITGTSRMTLVNGRIVDLLVKGKRSSGVALLQLAGDKVANPAYGAIKMKITVRTYTNATADVEAMSGKAFGQSLKWPL